MPIRKLKPIEERDPYAAAVLNAFDEMKEKFPSAEVVRPTLEELAAESRVAELAKRIRAESAKGNGLEELAAAKAEIAKLNEALQKSFAYSDELGWALDAQIGISKEVIAESNKSGKSISAIEHLLKQGVPMFWHYSGVFVVGKWECQAKTLCEAVTIAFVEYGEKDK